MFFLLPDFKGTRGQGLWGAANTIKDIYTWWDDNFLGPWEDAMGPIGMNTADQLGALTGGVIPQLGDIAKRAISFLIAATEVLVVRQYDVFGLLGSGVQDGYDEQTFFWSDMFHYRNTFEFGRHLFQKAQADGNDAHTAFALGWMSHLATDVTGHAFTNEKCGGPYRLHWQRHKLVENHMDAKVCDSEHGGDAIYNMLSNSALHLWIAFHGDGSSVHNFFGAQPGPIYATGDSTPDILDRRSKWDVDSDLPDDLAAFIADAAAEFFTDATTHVATPTGAAASHPTIINDIQPGTAGYADADAVATTYWWLYHYIKWTTTDYYELRRPSAPNVIQIPPFPSPPGSGSPSPGPGDDSNTWADALSILLAILAWLIYIAQVIAWGVAALISIVTTLTTYPLRLLVYEYIEIPLYNAWSALHFYLAHTGFVLPMKTEMNPGLMTLGTAPQDTWAQVKTALNDLSGGIGAPTGAGDEPSGRARSEHLPREVVCDSPGQVSVLAQVTAAQDCPPGRTPSEFLRPWLYPARNMNGSAVLAEPAENELSPYDTGQDATVLTAPLLGDAAARADFETARSEKETIDFQRKHLREHKTLGGPVDFTGYVVAKLTRDQADVTNYNLDSDRGYAYLCWDWLRDAAAQAAPEAYQDTANPANSTHQYNPPTAPGHGWCASDVISGSAAPMHDAKAPQQVQVRYIGREEKFA
jgi:hypothetical protein